RHLRVRRGARQRARGSVPPGEERRAGPRPARELRARGGRVVILLPAVDIRGGRCVRLVQGDFAQETVYDEDPVAVAKRYESEGAEWLHVVDLDAALEGVPRNRELVADVIRSIGIPVQCSGGIRDAEALNAAKAAGAARVVVGTAALRDPAFVEEALAEHHGFVAVGLDVRGEILQA